MSIARTPSVRSACFTWDWRSVWGAANDSADCPMATAAAADSPAFSTFRRDSTSTQLHPSDVFIDFLLNSDTREAFMRPNLEHIPDWGPYWYRDCRNCEAVWGVSSTGCSLCYWRLSAVKQAVTSTGFRWEG